MEENKRDIYEDSKWNRERFRRMDEALTRIEELADYMLKDLTGVTAALKELERIKGEEARIALIQGLALKTGMMMNGMEGIKEHINRGLTVPEAQEK